MTLAPHPFETWYCGRKCAHRRYYLTCSEYDDMRDITGGRCWLCAVPENLSSTFTLMVPDHDHTLGRWAVRGLLCKACNIRVERPHLHPGLDIAGYLANPWHQRIGRLGQPARRRNLVRT